MTSAIYFTNKPNPDTAIVNGLQAAGCQVIHARSISETLAHLNNGAGSSAVLVADLQAGAIPLLTLLAEQGRSPTAGWSFADALASPIPPTMIIDSEGSNVAPVIRSLQLGVRDYVLSSARDSEREMAARLLVERSQCAESLVHTSTMVAADGVTAPVALPRPGEPSRFVWIPKENVIRCADGDVFVSQTEGRIFDVLVRCQGQVVSVGDLLSDALKCPDVDLDLGVARLRTHMMRLRQKLQAHATMANRIVNVRGSGYMLV
jgi:DNA-binding response OmpR family regulator